MERIKLINYVSAFVALTLLISSFASKDPGIIGNVAILSTFLAATPRLYYEYKKYREFKEMEEKFPIFLRDLTESIRSGISLPKAIQAVSKLNYGALTKEIRKLSNQISWGIPADKALLMFGERVKKSKRLYTSIKILRETYVSGGDIASILESVADSCEMLEEIEKDRKSIMHQYVVLMYAISIIFVIIAIAINKFLLPIFKSNYIGTGIISPCANPFGFGYYICKLYGYTSKFLFSMDPSTPASYYTSLFFYMSIIQAIFCGLIAGQISEGSVKAGIRHSLILSGIVIGLFLLSVRFGLMVS